MKNYVWSEKQKPKCVSPRSLQIQSSAPPNCNFSQHSEKFFGDNIPKHVILGTSLL